MWRRQRAPCAGSSIDSCHCPTRKRLREAEAAANERHSRALTPAERELWKKAKRSLGRPKRGRGAKPVNITVERGLLERADAYAERHGLTRSQVVARGLVLAIAG